MKNKILFSILLFAVLTAGVSCSKPKQSKSSQSSKAASNIAYYTCTMHTFVRSPVPGKCPICGMTLVPVMKKHSKKMPAKDQAKNTPKEFYVPVKRQQQIGVTYGEVVEKRLQRTVRVVGMVAADQQKNRTFVARAAGYVKNLNVKSAGESVKKGEPLLTIYSPDLLTAEREFVDLLALQDRSRKAGGKAQSESVNELITASRQRLLQWNVTDKQIAALEKTRKPKQTMTLFSPFSGTVESIPIDPGQSVKIGDPLVRIADLSTVWVWADFYQDELAQLKPGMRVTITTSSYPGKKFSGKVSVIDPFLSAGLRTAKARIDVANRDLKLRPSMFVNVALTIDDGTHLAVPVSAVLPTGSHNVVFVDKGDGNLEPRFVKLGAQFGNVFEVRGGLKKGERVVTSANFLIDAESSIQGALKTW